MLRLVVGHLPINGENAASQILPLAGHTCVAAEELNDQKVEDDAR